MYLVTISIDKKCNQAISRLVINLIETLRPPMDVMINNTPLRLQCLASGHWVEHMIVNNIIRDLLICKGNIIIGTYECINYNFSENSGRSKKRARNQASNTKIWRDVSRADSHLFCTFRNYVYQYTLDPQTQGSDRVFYKAEDFRGLTAVSQHSAFFPFTRPQSYFRVYTGTALPPLQMNKRHFNRWRKRPFKPVALDDPVGCLRD